MIPYPSSTQLSYVIKKKTSMFHRKFHSDFKFFAMGKSGIDVIFVSVCLTQWFPNWYAYQ